MTPDSALASYRAHIGSVGEDVIVRRFTGPAGPNRTKVEATIRARVVGIQSAALIGAVVQGKCTVIALNDPAAAVPAGMVALSDLLPLTTDDFIVVRGKQLQMEAIDDNTRRIGGVLIALDIQAKG